MTPADLFDRAGRALYGDHYVAPLAFALKVEKGTVRNWAAGKSTVPRGVWQTIRLELIRRREEAEVVAHAVGDHIRAMMDNESNRRNEKTP